MGQFKRLDISIQERKRKPYVVVISVNDPRQKYALSRNYVLMGDDADIDSCTLADVVEVHDGRAPSFVCPDWVDDDKDTFVSLWFNYHDQSAEEPK